MSVDTIDTPVFEAPRSGAMIGPLDNRFHVVAVACRRVIQIRNGSRARVDPGGHKPCVVAVAEVMAGLVPYSLS
jgi:DNA-directed RNA polymerase omega subunit